MKKKLIAMGAVLALAMMLAACSQSESPAASSTSPEVGQAASQATSTEVEQAAAQAEEEAWKQEPAYGKTLQYAFGGANCVGAQMVADILGFYEEEGLSMESLSVQSLLDACATGQVVLTEAHVSQSFIPMVNGLDMVMVGTAMTGCQSLYVLNDSEFQNTADLVGKNVGIPNGFGSQDHNIVLRFMGRDGLEADDYNFKVVDRSAVIQSMQNGELDASLLADMFAYKFVKDGTIRPIRSLTWDEDFNKEPCCTILMNGEFVRDNPITAKKIARAVAKASAWIDSHTDESVELMVENDMMSFEPDNLEEVRNLQGSYDWTVTDAACEEALRNIIVDYQHFGLIDEAYDADELIGKYWKPLLTDEELEEVWAAGAAFEAQE